MYDQMFDDEEAFVKFFGENDSEENRKALLKTSKLCCWYCINIKDRTKVRECITESEWAYRYCKWIYFASRKRIHRPEIRKYITESEWAYKYCRLVKDIPEVRKYIVESKWAYYYCRIMKNRPEIRKYIIDDKWVCKYLNAMQDKYGNIPHELAIQKEGN